jgi:hypothetical protein
MDLSGREELGESSTALRVEDFELVKTLGTGRLGVLLPLILSDASTPDGWRDVTEMGRGITLMTLYGQELLRGFGLRG